MRLRRRLAVCVVVLSGVGDGVASRGLEGQRHASGGPTLWGIINTPRTLRSAFWSPSPGSPVTSAPNGTTPVWQYQVGSLMLWSRNARLDTASPGWLASPADVTGDPGHHELCFLPRCHIVHEQQLSPRLLLLRKTVVNVGGCEYSAVAWPFSHIHEDQHALGRVDRSMAAVAITQKWCLGSPVTSAGVANLAGPAVSSRAFLDHTKSDPA